MKGVEPDVAFCLLQPVHLNCVNIDHGFIFFFFFLLCCANSGCWWPPLGSLHHGPMPSTHTWGADLVKLGLIAPFLSLPLSSAGSKSITELITIIKNSCSCWVTEKIGQERKRKQKWKAWWVAKSLSPAPLLHSHSNLSKDSFLFPFFSLRCLQEHSLHTPLSSFFFELGRARHFIFKSVKAVPVTVSTAVQKDENGSNFHTRAEIWKPDQGVCLHVYFSFGERMAIRTRDNNKPETTDKASPKLNPQSIRRFRVCRNL